MFIGALIVEMLIDHRVHRPLHSVSQRPRARLGKHEWVERCSTRLMELRPLAPPELLFKVVLELWHAAPHFNPELAAEMEHESACWEH